MKERGTLFSTPMIRALLAGTKTQTRRLVTPANGEQRRWLTSAAIGDVQKVSVGRAQFDDPTSPLGVQLEHPRGGPLGFIACPYGEPGERLWVRETFCEWPAGGQCDEPVIPPTTTYEYAADHPTRKGWRPSICMPRAASRITLEITDVRVERLNAISEDDARAEGVSTYLPPKPKPTRPLEGLSGMQSTDVLDSIGERFDNARSAYRMLWDEINGKRAPWSSNPWVWALTFKRVRA